jgi:hypothetical protein
MTGIIDTLFGGPLGQRNSPIQRDVAHVLHRYEAMYGVFQERLNYQSSMASLEESKFETAHRARLRFHSAQLRHFSLWDECRHSLWERRKMVDCSHRYGDCILATHDTVIVY